MGGIFNTILYAPLLAVLTFIYNHFSFHDLGISIVILTLLIRTILFPFFHKAARDQAVMQKIQPRIRELQKIHKDDKERQAKELMALHKEHDLNPFSSLLLIIIQLPIIFALYKVIRESLASQVFTNHLFLGIWSVGQTSLALTLLASALQYIQGRLSLAAVPKSSGDDKEKTMASAGRTLVYLGPLFTFIVLYRLPVAIGIYWATSTLFSVAQQVHINEKLAHIRNEEKK